MHSPAVTVKTSPSTYTLISPEKHVEKLIFPRVDMGRWFGAQSHLTDNEVKRSVIIRGARHLAMKHTFVPLRIS